MNKINKSFPRLVYPIILNFIFFLTVNVYAGSTAFDSTAVKGLLLKASMFYNTSSGLEIEFESRVFWSALEEWHSSKGIFISGPRNKYRLDLPELVIVSDGKTLWKYNVEGSQVIIDSIGNSDNHNHPARLLFDFLTCRPLSIEEVKQDKKDYYHIMLEPGPQFPQYDTIAVYLQMTDSRPYKVETVDESENKNIYTIQKIKNNVVLTEKIFRFVPPPGTEVVDLRY